MTDEQMIYLGLGSNMDDRYQNIKNGVTFLNTHPHIWVTDYSYIYQSVPMYNVKQDDYYNMVISILTNLTPMGFLNEIKIIETKVGRKKQRKNNMPRMLDIDILAFGNPEIAYNSYPPLVASETEVNEIGDTYKLA